jgi:hypothetical protein
MFHSEPFQIGLVLRQSANGFVAFRFDKTDSLFVNGRLITFGILLVGANSCHGRYLTYFTRSCRKGMRFQPQHTGCDGRIKACGFPPCGFVAAAVNLAMMSPAQRDRELVADLASQGSTLCEAQMVGIRRLPAAHETRLRSHISDVFAITNSARLRQR